MKEILNHLFANRALGRQQAKEVLMKIAKGDYNQSQITAFLSAYIMRQATVEEMQGFRDALLELCVFIGLEEYETIDLCGTGGDAKNTFNISTLAAFVVAGAGVKVAKHGNYSASSVTGSSNILEFFGCRFTSDNDVLKKQIEEAGICFLHAPLFHPAMKIVAPARKELGVKTFFNMLGPLVNPALPKFQCTGVFSLALARLYQYLLQGTDRKFMILHSFDGYDEISLTGGFKMISNKKEEQLDPWQLGFPKYCTHDLCGGQSVESAAKIFMNVLLGNGTPAQCDVVIVNAACAIKTVRQEASIKDCIAEAAESLDSKKALFTFYKFLNTNS